MAPDAFILEEDVPLGELFLRESFDRPPRLTAAASADEAMMGSADRPLYPQAYIEDIRDNWTTKQEAMLMLQMTDHQLWHWLNLSGRKARLIGKVSLIRRADIWEELRRRAGRKTA